MSQQGAAQEYECRMGDEWYYISYPIVEKYSLLTHVSTDNGSHWSQQTHDTIQAFTYASYGVIASHPRQW